MSDENFDAQTSPLREAMLPMIRRAHGDERGKVIMRRIEARLDGYSHAEVAEMFPLPDVGPPAEGKNDG